MFERIGRLLAFLATRRRRAVLVVSAIAVAILLAGLPRARFSTDYKVFFSKEDPGLAAFERLERAFARTDNVLFVVKADRGDVFSRETLEAVQELTAEGWRVPHASRVDSITNFQRARSAGDDIAVGDLVKGPARWLSDADLADVRAAASSEPILVGSILAKDGKTTAVNVTLHLPRKDPREVSDAADAARAIAVRVAAKHPSLEIRPCGMAFMNDAFMQASVRDMAVMIPLMLVVMLGAMALILKSARATAAVATVLVLSAAGSMAIAGWLGYPLTPPSVAAPMMVLTVAIADGVHIVLATREALGEGRDKDGAIERALEANLEALTYTWLTTIVGFVCLNYSAAAPVRHLANMTCVGVTVAFVLSVTMLPAMLARMPLAPRPPHDEGRASIFARLAAFVVRRRFAVVAGATLLTGVFGLAASRLETNDEFVQYFGKSLEFRKNVDFTMQSLSGIYRLEYQVGSKDGVTDPAYLAQLDAFSTYLRAQPEVQHVFALPDVVKRVHEATSGAYALPATREAAGEDLLVYEMGLPAGLDLTDRVNVDKSASRVTVTVRDMSTREMGAFTARTEAWLRESAPREMWAEASGPVVIFSQLSERNTKGMVQGDIVSLALISLCMIIVLRSAKLGLLSVVPNVIPIVVGYGVWRLAAQEMNIVASIAGSISLGVIVDDTIHFLTKYRATVRTSALGPEEAMEKTLAHVAPAMLSTTAILVLGFGVLTFSSFQMTSSLGWLSVLIVGVAPFCDLVLVPALVAVFSEVSHEENHSLSPLRTRALALFRR